jgi:hypothetical protein
MPSVQTMVSRKSSITNAFVNSVIPVVEPSIDEIEKALTILGMNPADVRCAYCGDKSSEWDHLRPLVLSQRPTGYISEIANLVPACGKCNQSKGNKPWRDWMMSTSAPQSPTTRKITDVAERMQKLEDYERAFIPRQIDFAKALGEEEWARYWQMWKTVNDDLRTCQEFAEILKTKIHASLMPT